ncbi:class II aldolase/adducin family protein [Asticcacaulis sp. AND118]|uniref:class II aldolase/adducin family protein n=1 Tax=Asticcacaulis sp. AND118 TaxID=2840468 RepID=UPI001CFF9D61|nr:class II aldolase/adducin family protein [Asticcacaulis sp. AND118]UDF02201.1 class II aldolase/adducin family protein [Asticcacaulis sp. AND118]
MPADTAPADPLISPAEWAIRKDLAALYRLVALFGWDDTIFTHISARVPAKDSRVTGPDGPVASQVDHFLINPYGMFFEEMTASALIKVDLDGNMVGRSEGFVNPAGFTIHSALHAACPDAHVVIHLHTDAMTGVSAQKEGLLPLTQNALLLGPHITYHGYEGVALDPDERQRIVADLGQKKIMLLRNHGALAYGASAAEAFTLIYFLEQACRQQIAALSAGRDGVLEASQDAQDKVAPLGAGVGFVSGLLWPGLMRRLERNYPGWDA